MTELPHKNIRAIAIHLPQFHTIPENDEWWGKGFTEWTNVKKAEPLFNKHYQPHIPLNNNYYDLGDNKVLCDQANMAREYGIHGFCFYHYWFNGKKLLEKPLEQMLELGKPDFPFMLCWANENWTRTWDGMEKDVLMKQEYNLGDDEQHFEYLLPYFMDDRYITIDSKPVFVIYRSELFPDIIQTIETWRRMARDHGLEGLYLVRVESFERNIDPVSLGFDAAMEFQPNWEYLPERLTENLWQRLKNKLSNSYSNDIYREHKIYSYSEFIDKQIARITNRSYNTYPSVIPGWDNSPRRTKDSVIFKNNSPELYGRWLKNTVDNFKPYSEEENLVFINAWNEWGEGNHLEPCEKWGKTYLEVTRRVLGSLNRHLSN